MLLTKDGDTDNSYMYVGEEYNANTGLYYLRARYMNPSTGSFTTMDSYQGSLYEPISLHKYAYANANPVTYTDPTGYFSIAECTVVQTIRTNINEIVQIQALKKVMFWANAVCTAYDVYTTTMNILYGDGKVLDVVCALVKGLTINALINCLLATPLAIVTKPMVAIYGVKDQMKLINEAIEKGDPVEIGIRVVQLITMVFGIMAQCFTGETLVETDEGLVAIEDIEVGDYVLAEDTVTGETEYKKVIDVHMSQTNKLVHVVTEGSDNNLLSNFSDEESTTTINTTDNHPFYVEGKGWVPAIELEAGDVLRTADGDVEVVKEVYVEYLDESVLIYNLEIEGYHTYFVSDENVLVHNECGNKTYQTYTKQNPETGEVYSGRTSGTGTPAENVRNRDVNHHMNDRGFGPAVLDKASCNYEAIRGREQMLIDYNGGAQSMGGTSGNAINGISPSNDKMNIYINAAKGEFGDIE